MTRGVASAKGNQAGQPVVAVFVVIFTVHEQELKVLLIRRDLEPFRGWWAIPGGRLGTGEPLDEAAARKLVEETGVRDVYLEQLYTFGDLDRTAPAGALAIGYFALVNYDSVSLPKREDWPTAWFSIDDLPASPTGQRELAFDNRQVLDYARRRLRYKLEYTNVAYSLLPPYFTMSQLQTVYELILGKRLDKRNFRKRILALGIVQPTERTVIFGAHRPAKLYTFASRQPQII